MNILPPAVAFRRAPPLPLERGVDMDSRTQARKGFFVGCCAAAAFAPCFIVLPAVADALARVLGLVGSG